MIDKIFILESDELSSKDLMAYIEKHTTLKERYRVLEDYYVGKHPILGQAPKPDYKPDNRIVVNYPKYIVDTLNGFFMGVPVKVSHDDEAVDDYLKEISRINNLEDSDSDLSKKCSIYGHAFELLFLDEDGNVGITQISPMECFIIYDDSIRRRPLYGVRYRVDSDGNIQGTISDDLTIKYFSIVKNEFSYTDEIRHYFGEVPIVEYVENEERIGAFEPVETLINAYNKAISEKANDVDYFADAYLKILGAKLEKEDLEVIRDNRIINLPTEDTDKLIVEFMEKPNADKTQENLIDRLEKQIFATSMVANINDENFGTSSGIALKYKLLSMTNLVNTKERKFMKSFNHRYRLISNLPNSKISYDDLVGINYKFTKNIPQNTVEEADIAKSLRGIVSNETLLENLSMISDSKAEVERLKEEEGYNVGLDYEYEEHEE